MGDPRNDSMGESSGDNVEREQPGDNVEREWPGDNIEREWPGDNVERGWVARCSIMNGRTIGVQPSTSGISEKRY